jgi:hypothetical protein
MAFSMDENREWLCFYLLTPRANHQRGGGSRRMSCGPGYAVRLFWRGFFALHGHADVRSHLAV